MPEVWNIFAYYLTETCWRYGTEIHSFVLMSNHYHLIVSTPYCNLGQAMRYLQSETAKAIQTKAGRINHVFGDRYKWSVLEGTDAVAFAYKYVMRNPVRAGICKRVEEYDFGISSGYGNYQSGIPLVCGIGTQWKMVPKTSETQLEWLNQPAPREVEDVIQKALRRYQFKFSRGNYARRTVDMAHSAYGIFGPTPFENLAVDESQN